MFSFSNGSAAMSEDELYVDLAATEVATSTPPSVINQNRRSGSDYYPDIKGMYRSMVGTHSCP